jgi:hypothetical protein
MDVQQIRERTAPLVHYVREHGHTATPILLVSGTPYRKAWLVNSTGTPAAIADAASGASARALAEECAKLQAAGVQQISFLNGSSLFGTVAGHGGGDDDDPTFNSIQ